MVSDLIDFDVLSINDVANLVQQTALEHGFVEPVCNVDQKLLLAVGELVEAQNDLRDGHLLNEVYYEGPSGKPCGVVIELADCVIRIFNLAKELGLDIQEGIRLKAIYNDTRPYKHGKKF